MPKVRRVRPRSVAGVSELPHGRLLGEQDRVKVPRQSGGRGRACLREIVIYRKIRGILRSEESMKNFCNIFTYIATWQNYGLDYLADGAVRVNRPKRREHIRVCQNLLPGPTQDGARSPSSLRHEIVHGNVHGRSEESELTIRRKLHATRNVLYFAVILTVSIRVVLSFLPYLQELRSRSECILVRL